MSCTCWTSRGHGAVRIDERLKGGQRAAVEAKAYRTDFDQPVHHGVEAGGLGVKDHIRHIGETWLGLIHRPSRSFLGEPLT
jgi:hypothetical protein